MDDIQENLELLEDVLSENGYRTVIARNGVEALQLLKAETVHMIVADAMMPKMDGFQLCKEVRTLPACATLPFIIYTGNYVDAGDQEFARSIGVDRYVVKYAGLGALVQAINELAQHHYGRIPEEPEPVQEQLDDQEFLEKHRAIVIKKLEEKMAELEMYADTLIRKNREIQASEDRYRTLFDHASIAIFVLDRETGQDRGREPRRDRAARVRARGTPGHGPSAVLRHASSHRPCSTPTHFASGETTITRKDGESVQVDLGVGPVTRPQDTRVLLYVRDISEQKKMREQLIQADKLTLMGRLAAGIAHEIRNPLSAIALNLQYLIFKTQTPHRIVRSAEGCTGRDAQDRGGDREYAEPRARHAARAQGGTDQRPRAPGARVHQDLGAAEGYPFCHAPRGWTAAGARSMRSRCSRWC